MCQLPRTQPASMELVTNMLNGIAEHPQIFTSVDTQKLSAACQSFEQAKNAYDQAYSQLVEAGAWQKKAFAALKKQIANQAKAAQVDTADIFKLAVREDIARAKYIPQEESEKIPAIRKTITEQIKKLYSSALA